METYIFMGQFKWPQCLLSNTQSAKNGREIADMEKKQNKKTVIPQSYWLHFHCPVKGFKYFEQRITLNVALVAEKKQQE